MIKTILQDVRRWRFWRHFGVHSFAALGVIALALGLFDVLFPDIFEGVGTGLGVIIVVLSAVYGLIRAWPRPIQQSYDSPNVTIKLVEGDLFAQPGHLVVGMSTTFDTSVPHVVAKDSVQAQFLDRMYDSDVATLDHDLAEALVGRDPHKTIIKRGKTDAYEIGTVATLKDHARCYFCVAYTEMDEQCVARATIDGVWRSLDELWREVCKHANGGAISIPVIGGGQARLSQILPAQDSIRFIILSFILACRREKVCDELRIIVRSVDYERLDRLELQAFLRSLKKS